MSSFTVLTASAETVVTVGPNVTVDSDVTVGHDVTDHVITDFELLALGSDISVTVVPVVPVVPAIIGDPIVVPGIIGDPISDPVVSITDPGVSITDPVVSITDPIVSITDPVVSIGEPIVTVGPFQLSCILELTPEKAQILIDKLAECNCCARHMENKPTVFGPFTKSPFWSPKTDELKSCKCYCRSNARDICRSYRKITGEDSELRQDIEK